MPRRPRSEASEIRELTAELQRADNPFTFARLADLLCEQGRLAEARSLCEQCIARYPTYATIRLTLARVCEAEGDLDRAEVQLRAAIGAEPHNRSSRVALGRLLLQRGAVAEAREHLSHALFLAPSDSTARALLARASGQEAVPAEAPPASAAFAEPEPPQSAATVERALMLLGGTDGVCAALLVDPSGLLIGSYSRGLPEDVMAALASEVWQLARASIARMHLGPLRQGTVAGNWHTFVLASSPLGLLAVVLVPAAKLGLVNLQLEAARNILAAL